MRTDILFTKPKKSSSMPFKGYICSLLDSRSKGRERRKNECAKRENAGYSMDQSKAYGERALKRAESSGKS